MIKNISTLIIITILCFSCKKEHDLSLEKKEHGQPMETRKNGQPIETIGDFDIIVEIDEKTKEISRVIEFLSQNADALKNKDALIEKMRDSYQINKNSVVIKKSNRLVFSVRTESDNDQIAHKKTWIAYEYFKYLK